MNMNQVSKTIKEKIEKLESFFLKEKQIECSVKHSFAPNMYIREVSMPKGSFVIGHEQKYEHFNIFIKGKLLFLNDDGTTQVLEAPLSFVGKPGRKVSLTLEDSVWQNVYSTNEQNIETLEEIYLNKSPAFQEHFEKAKQLKSEADVIDFKESIKLLGFDEKQVSEISSNELDMIDLPFGDYKFKKSKSNIHGYGVFATGNIQENEIIGPARIDNKRTILGRYVNHSISPNAEMFIHNKNIYLKAIHPICGCQGGYDGDEITIDYKKAVLENLKLSEGVKCQE